MKTFPDSICENFKLIMLNSQPLGILSKEGEVIWTNLERNVNKL